MPIPFSCPHCGRYTEVSDEYAGQTGPCAGCGKPITVPGAAGMPAKPGAAVGPQGGPPRSQFPTTMVLLLALGVVCLCGSGILVALLLPAVQAAREAARRMSCSNNLKQIALAMHNYHDVYKAFPAGFMADESGKPMHSWRVALLPYLEQAALYDQYNFDEPWDSPNNLRVAERMPQVFQCPSAPTVGPDSNLTNYVVILSDTVPDQPSESMFGANRWTRMGEIRDGTSSTIMIVEVREPVPWTQPDTDLHFDSMSFQINGGPESIGSFHPMGAMVGFADGSVQYLHDDVDPQTLRFLIQPADGNFIQPNFQ